MSEEKLRAALKPFADCYLQIDDDEPDSEWAKFRLTIGDYRRARQAMDTLVGPTFESIHNMALEQAAQAAMRVARRYRDSDYFIKANPQGTIMHIWNSARCIHDEIMNGRLLGKETPGSNPPPPAGDKPKPPANPPPAHDLYKTSDADAPDQIRDRNGAVVLDLCKRCNRGESELSEPCTPAPMTNEALLQEVEKHMHTSQGADPDHIIEMARRFKALIQAPEKDIQAAYDQGQKDLIRAMEPAGVIFRDGMTLPTITGTPKEMPIKTQQIAYFLPEKPSLLNVKVTGRESGGKAYKISYFNNESKESSDV